jgi:antagonist of KipI
MHKTTLEFVRPGLHTLIQDLGRNAHRAYGVPLGGALDRGSAIIANKLVGNAFNSPVFEITISGPQIKFNGDDCRIALCGADMSATLNDTQLEMYRSHMIKSGDILAFGKLKRGCRTYLAVNGEWQVKRWLGSASAIFSDLPDITPDSYIRKGNEIAILHEAVSSKENYQVQVTPDQLANKVIRLMPGPELHLFSKEVIRDFYNTDHPISSASNRWGYRLDSTVQIIGPQVEIISSGVIPGTIQITHSGQPVILMADAQTTGGYPRLAVVVSADLDKLAQYKPGDTVRFQISDINIS